MSLVNFIRIKHFACECFEVRKRKRGMPNLMLCYSQGGYQALILFLHLIESQFCVVLKRRMPSKSVESGSSMVLCSKVFGDDRWYDMHGEGK